MTLELERTADAKDQDDGVLLPGWRALSPGRLQRALERRAARALELVGEAHAAGDAVRLRQALERYFYRIVQLEHLRDAEGTFCQLCDPDRVRREGYRRADWCLAHFAGPLRERARRRAAEVWDGWEGPPARRS